MLYNEKEVLGTQYLRSRLIEVHNQLGVTPHVAFVEEMVTTLGDYVSHKDVGTLRVDYNPASVIPLINPQTQEPILDASGTQVVMTHEQIMVALYSLYMQAVLARDYVAPVVVVPEVVEVPNAGL